MKCPILLRFHAWCAIGAIALSTSSVPAQSGGAPKPDEKGRASDGDAPVIVAPAEPAKPKPQPVLRLKEPVAGRVYQRDANGKADIPIVLDETEGVKDTRIGATFASAHVSPQPRFEDGKLVGVPTGGPYSILTQGASFPFASQTENLFVGDLWILAGQSNMEGYGDLIDVAEPNDQVRLLGMDGKWSRAEEPLHWLVDSPDPVHSQNPQDRAARSAVFHKIRKKGAGLGLAFADALQRATNVPIGLIATAHGGTSMKQWSPADQDKGGDSLYGSMMRSVKLAGGKVKGVLWYQGESDAMKPEAAKIYAQTFTDFIAALRKDLDQPDLPFYYVQIGRFVNGGSPKDWNAVQDAQRLIAERVPNTAVVASVDLELDDGIHISTSGQKRLGRRLARIAERELFGQVGATTPTFDRVNKGSGNTLVVKFKGVNISHESAARGIPGGARGPGGQGMMSVPLQVAQFGGPGVMGGGGGGAAARPSTTVVGLKPSRHIAGFSIRKEDGEDIPIIFDAAVGPARDTVILKLNKPLPAKSYLHYGYGFDPYCNLNDALDMAVPVFGPIALDDVK